MTSNLKKSVQGNLSHLLEREEVIECTLAALVAGEHVLLLGPPGTAKSELARGFCNSLDGATYFEWLLTRFSTPEEIFGPISLKALKNDKFNRVLTGKLPEAHIAFLDEIFKASSAILNSLLTIVNERVYHNNGSAVKTPLISLIGASNELPQAEDLSALYDRFLVKFWVGYVSDGNFMNLLKLPENRLRPVVTLADIESARKEIKKMKVPNEVFGAFGKLRTALSSEGIILSDRKWRKALELVKAFAFINDAAAPTPEDLEILKHVAWNKPEERPKAAKLVASVCNPLKAVLLDIEDSVQEIFDNAMSAQTPEAGAEANSKIKEFGQQLAKLKEKHPDQAKAIKATADKIQGLNRRVIKDILGLEL